MTRASSTAPAARPASTPPPVGRVLLTEEQRDFVLEATAYRFPHYSIEYGAGDVCDLEIRASAWNANRRIWGPYTLGRGSWHEMNRLREAAMAEYDRLTGRER